MTVAERIERMTEDEAETLLQILTDETWNAIDLTEDTNVALVTAACEIDPDFAAIVESGQW